MKSEWASLKDYIRILLKDGKRSEHPNFKLLFLIYGREKVIELAKEVLEEEKQKDGSNTNA